MDFIDDNVVNGVCVEVNEKSFTALNKSDNSSCCVHSINAEAAEPLSQSSDLIFVEDIKETLNRKTKNDMNHEPRTPDLTPVHARSNTKALDNLSSFLIASTGSLTKHTRNFQNNNKNTKQQTKEEKEHGDDIDVEQNENKEEVDKVRSKGQDRSRRNNEPLCDVKDEQKKHLTLPFKILSHSNGLEVEMNSECNNLVRKRERPIDKDDCDDDGDESNAYKLSHTAKGKRRSVDKSSCFRGVSKCTKDGRWQTRIRVGNAVKYLGRFQTEEIAARCYDAAFITYFGKEIASQIQLNYSDSVLLFDRSISQSKFVEHLSNSSITQEALQMSQSILSKIGIPTNGSLPVASKQLERYKKSISKNANNEDKRSEVTMKHLNPEKKRNLDASIHETFATHSLKERRAVKEEKGQNIINEDIANPFLAPINTAISLKMSHFNTFIPNQVIKDKVTEMNNQIVIQSREIMAAYHLLSLSYARSG